MKKIIYPIIFTFLFASCKSSKNYLLRSDEDKTLYDIVKKINKQPKDAAATAALPEVYKQVQQQHLNTISAYRNYSDINRWDKLSSEYQQLQNMHDAIDNSVASKQLVSPVSYQSELGGIKNSAAADYYQLGEDYLAYNDRGNARKAYQSFKQSDKWVRGYRDAKAKMQEAYNNSIINILVNPIQDNSFFVNNGWGNNGYRYSNDYFQQSLIKDLGGRYATRYPAKFYTEWEVRNENIIPDWVVDLKLRNMDIPRPLINNYTRNVSKQIQNGKDTTGKPLYQTVYATLNIQKQYFNARAQMDINIVDLATRRNIAYNSYTDTYNWSEEVATYTGDRRALNDEDWRIINKNNFNSPGRDDILNQLYRNIYPQVKNRISNEVDW